MNIDDIENMNIHMMLVHSHSSLHAIAMALHCFEFFVGEGQVAALCSFHNSGTHASIYNLKQTSSMYHQNSIVTAISL